MQAASRHEWPGVTACSSRDVKRLRLVCCADTPSALPLRSFETCIRSNCIEVVRRKPSVWLRAVGVSRASLVLCVRYRQLSRSAIVNRSMCLLHVRPWIMGLTASQFLVPDYLPGRVKLSDSDRSHEFCSKTSGQLPCARLARHSGQGSCERIPPYGQRCCRMSQGVRCIRRVVTFITQCHIFARRCGYATATSGRGLATLQACRPQWSRSPALPPLQIADQECKRLDYDRVVICSFLHPTTDRCSETLTSVSSRNVWCRPGWSE